MEFIEEVVGVLAKRAAELFNVDAATLSAATRFNEDLHCKSVDLVKFTTTLEDEYDVEVPFMAFKRSLTFGDAAAFVADALGVS